ncbi:MAG: cation diffusion facilitator family transporter [Acidimicrobiia bacterium]|nr:MAG: cation diffusion facilitator family transporter [Acidimicrobiia bacterium]
MSSGYDHGSSASVRYTKPLAIAFGLVASFAIVEFIAGISSGSLALTADAGHMATDAIGLGMALAAAVVSKRVKPSSTQTYGLYRVEILAALANAVLLAGVATYVIVVAIIRLREPVEVQTALMLVVAVGGLLVNLVSFRLLRQGADESLNVEGAFLEVLGDLLASVGVIVAGAVILITGWYVVDAIVGIAIGLFILPRALSLGRRAIRILMEVAPEGIDVESMREKLLALPDVVEVHDLHVWTLTSEMHTATAHLVISDGVDGHPTLDAARAALSTEFGIDHATLQIEPESHTGCHEVAW